MTLAERYYREELRYLRAMGREFARAHPETARFLGAEGADPDVERLLEGTAFLTARLRQRLDQECPELIAEALDALWPQHLLPTPSMTVLRFDPPPRALEPLLLPRGAQAESRPLDGTRCRFATVHPARVVPLSLSGCDWIDGERLRLRFTVPRGADARALVGPSLRLHLDGDGADARWLRWRLLAHGRGIVVRCGGKEATLPVSALRPAGFAEDEALLPSPVPVPPRLRLLHEYAHFPEKLLFLDLVGLDGVAALAGAESFEVLFSLARLPAESPREARLALNCVPAVNLFPMEGEPLRCDPDAERIVRAAGDPRHHEVFSVEEVVGAAPGSAANRRFVAAHRRRRGEEADATFRLRRWPRPDGDGSEVSLALDGEPREGEVVSTRLLCSNRRLAARLGVGDLCIAGAGMPAALRLANLGKPTAPLQAAPPTELRGRLVAHLALGDPAASVDELRSLLSLCDAAAGPSPRRPLASLITAVETRPAVRLLEGLPIRGREVAVRLAEGAFAAAADQHLFGCVLEAALAACSPLNRFLSLRLVGAGEPA